MKKCPFCAEEIQDDALKCKHCKSDINKQNKSENPNKYKDLAIASFVLGILSIFFGSIGIIPLVALIVSIVSLFKIKQMKNRNKIFTITGFILALVYCINFFFVYSSIEPSILDMSHNDEKKDNTSDISKMQTNKTLNENDDWINKSPEKHRFLKFFLKDNKVGGKNGYIWHSVEWDFDNDIDTATKLSEWNYYENCQLYFMQEDTRYINMKNIVSRKNYYAIENNFYDNLTNNFCVKIFCDSGLESNKSCFEKK
ncbi:MAG: DUF4190 domain-containing protein [Patescibacteria group bacterium]|nr:DUF4190 domain-containing protein [Patescibacteria group bacterium]